MWLIKIIDYYSEKNNKYIILTPLLYAIGTASEEILYGLLKAKREHKRLIIIRARLPEKLCKYDISNPELYNIKSDYIIDVNHLKILIEYLVTIVFTTTRIISIILMKFNIYTSHKFNFPTAGHRDLWRNHTAENFSWDAVRLIEWNKLHQRQILTLRNEKLIEKHISDELFEGQLDSWYVCLHVREASYRKDYERRGYRNCDIKNYIPLINEITLRGGYVVRIGDTGMKRLPKMAKVIDYPFTNIKSPLVDLVLIKNCKFYVGNQSGPWDTANLFSKITVTTEMVHWLHTYPVKYGDIGSYKTIFDTKTHRNLNFLEIMGKGWPAMTLTNDISDRYQILDNSPEQLRSLILEFFSWLEKGVSYTKLQKHVNRERMRFGKIVIDQYETEEKKEVDTAKFRFASRLTTSQGTLSSNSLEGCQL
jgi:putative glycosyltransferase (TIGR04372 family)